MSYLCQHTCIYLFTRDSPNIALSAKRGILHKYITLYYTKQTEKYNTKPNISWAYYQ